MRRALLLAAVLLWPGWALAQDAAATPVTAEVPPPELLENLDFFKDYADTAEDGLWEDFEVVSSTSAFAQGEVVTP